MKCKRSAMHAFTLMETAITLALMGIIALAAVSLHASVGSAFVSTRRTTDLSDRLLSLSDYFSKELTTVGGNAASPAASILIESGSDCVARGEYPACPSGSDRVTTFSAVPGAPACRLSHMTSMAGQPPRASFWARPGGVGAPLCCLNHNKNGARVPGGPRTQYLKRFAILTSGPFHKPVMLIAEHLAPGEITPPAPLGYPPPGVDPVTGGVSQDYENDGFPDSHCTFRVVDVVPPGMRVEPPASQLDDWIDGTATIVDMRTYFIDARSPGAPPKLMVHTDLDDTGGGLSPTLTNSGTGGGVWNWTDAIEPEDETRVLADGVYDFQLSLGYDLNLDGSVDGSEWTHDAPGETRDPAQDPRLRLLRFDLVLGTPIRASIMQNVAVPTPARDGGATLKLPSVALRATSATHVPRNTDSILAGVN